MKGGAFVILFFARQQKPELETGHVRGAAVAIQITVAVFFFLFYSKLVIGNIIADWHTTLHTDKNDYNRAVPRNYFKFPVSLLLFIAKSIFKFAIAAQVGTLRIRSVIPVAAIKLIDCQDS